MSRATVAPVRILPFPALPLTTPSMLQDLTPIVEAASPSRSSFDGAGSVKEPALAPLLG
jgi:hypothetical protein